MPFQVQEVKTHSVILQPILVPLIGFVHKRGTYCFRTGAKEATRQICVSLNLLPRKRHFSSWFQCWYILYFPLFHSLSRSTKMQEPQP